MKKILAIITTLAIASPALAWGDREQGALAGIVGTLIFQHIQKEGNQPAPQQPQPVYVPGPVIIQQPPVIVTPVPRPRHRQVILQNTGVYCTPGLAAFYNEHTDQYGRPYYVFDGCR